MNTGKSDQASETGSNSSAKVTLMPGVLNTGFKEQDYSSDVSVQSLRAIQEAAGQPAEDDPIVYSESLL